MYFNATLANPASNSCLLYYNVATNQINLLNDSGTAWLTATLGAATTLAEQPVLAECGSDDGGAERQHA